tara:strand:- start:182 stop:535 length:354 start_codon:yes stop_codon:yes gene_type:complete
VSEYDHTDAQLDEMLAAQREERQATHHTGRGEDQYELPGAIDTQYIYHVAHEGWPLPVDRGREEQFANWLQSMRLVGIPRIAVQRAQESYARGRRFGPHNRGQQDHKSWDQPRNIYG